jgi:hypothetical protein
MECKVRGRVLVNYVGGWVSAPERAGSTRSATGPGHRPHEHPMTSYVSTLQLS